MADTSLHHNQTSPQSAAPVRARAASLHHVVLLAAMGAVLLVAGPWMFDTYLLNILIKAFFFAIAAITVDILWGYTGYLTFGQSAFFGIGAYAAGLTFTHAGFSASTALLAMGTTLLGCAAVAGLVGWLSFYRGASPFFATVISLVLPIVLTQLLLSGGSFTGSSSGLTGYPTFDGSIEAWYWAAGSLLTVAGVIGWVLVRSDAGRMLLAIRDNEARCTYLGINTSRVKTTLLIAMGVMAGIAGFGYSSFSGVVAPELTGFALGTELIIWVALGGRGTLWGPLASGVLVNVATAYLSSSMPFAWQLILGAAFVVVIVLFPQGLIPLLLQPFGLSRDVARAPLLRERAVTPGAQASGTALRMRGVTKNFGALKVLRGIDFEAQSGELVGLIGPNGAGKTTLMRCMSDGIERSGGTVELCGIDIRQLPPEVCVHLGLGRKFQNANIFESLTVAECLRIAGTRLERPSLLRQNPVLQLPAYALHVLHTTALDHKLTTVARDLSHGEQQALELAMVLALKPRVVLLDEPTAGLTKTERTQIGELLSSLAHQHGLCCLLVEHDLDLVAQISTRIVVLHQGTIVMQGSFQEVVNSPLVKTIYSGDARPQGEHA
ncbi:inner-membrane translocator [Hylemonella gracilis ATCC 19624]|uniref:Inner-membrane translocator n=1 Tax=Hylemonella gracilis ATCC 19624 TaxID=887062 RepID=F3KUU7_9BURK|nr:inner-membrane translocator [Hylemonella gracilis ATCC 19624]